MKNILILIVLVAFSACGNGKTTKSQPPAEDSLSNEKNIESAGVFDESNPMSVLITQYSPEQIKKLLGKSAPEDVRDLFVLLPDTLCYDYSAADRLKVARGQRVGEYGGMALSEESNIANGYIELSGAWEGIWEMFAKKENNTWWIALNQQFCGSICYTHYANTYTFENGRLIQHFDANLAGYQDIWPELFIDFEQLTKTQKQQATNTWEENKEYDCVLFRLPRDGKTITMYIDKEPYVGSGIPENAFKEVSKEIWK